MSALLGVFRRECHRLISRRLYLGVCVVLPLFCLFFMATIFGNGQMENIPIGIVDGDNSATSRSIICRIGSTPTFRVTEHYSNEVDARKALQRKDIYGYLVIPSRFETAAVNGGSAAPPTLCYYYHYALLSVGSQVMAAFENTLAAVALSPILLKAEALGMTEETMQTFLLPMEADVHPIYNPNMDYAVYLSQPIYFIMLQILLLLVTVYALGSETKFNTVSEWLGVARGNILVAITGKLLPYTVLFSVMGIGANCVLFGILHIPLSGSIWLLNALTVLFMVSTQALALFLYSLFPRMAYVISMVSMIGSLGATLSGVTFPVEAMYKPVYWASHILPIRHFVEAMQQVVYFGTGWVQCWQQIVILLLFPLIALETLPLLKWWLSRWKAVTIRPVARREWHRIIYNPAAVLVLGGGVFLYGLLYNYMYAPNQVYDTPMAVVDLSHSPLSRDYIRLLDATPQVSVTHRTPNLPEAREWLKQGKVAGILYLPADFETRVARNETSPFGLYAATDAFLDFKGLREATSLVMLAMNDKYRTENMASLPLGGMVATATSTPVRIVGTPLYNTTEGYGSYLIPAVLIVIIFQTMLMVIAMLRGEDEYDATTNIFSMVWRRTLVYVALYTIFSLFLLGLLPHVFSVPHIGNGWDIIGQLIPFLLSTALFAQALARWFTDAEAPLLMIAFFSVGYIFLSGVSYPLELMPWYWQMVHYIFPVTPAVLGFVQINSMEADLWDILPQLVTLWIQVFVYGAWALHTAKIRAKKMAIYPRQPIFC